MASTLNGWYEGSPKNEPTAVSGVFAMVKPAPLAILVLFGLSVLVVASVATSYAQTQQTTQITDDRGSPISNATYHWDDNKLVLNFTERINAFLIDRESIEVSDGECGFTLDRNEYVIPRHNFTSATVTLNDDHRLMLSGMTNPHIYAAYGALVTTNGTDLPATDAPLTILGEVQTTPCSTDSGSGPQTTIKDESEPGTTYDDLILVQNFSDIPKGATEVRTNSDCLQRFDLPGEDSVQVFLTTTDPATTIEPNSFLIEPTTTVDISDGRLVTTAIEPEQFEDIPPHLIPGETGTILELFTGVLNGTRVFVYQPTVGYVGLSLPGTGVLLLSIIYDDPTFVQNLDDIPDGATKVETGSDCLHRFELPGEHSVQVFLTPTKPLTTIIEPASEPTTEPEPTPEPEPEPEPPDCLKDVVGIERAYINVIERGLMEPACLTIAAIQGQALLDTIEELGWRPTPPELISLSDGWLFNIREAGQATALIGAADDTGLQLLLAGYHETFGELVLFFDESVTLADDWKDNITVGGVSLDKRAKDRMIDIDNMVRISVGDATNDDILDADSQTVIIKSGTIMDIDGNANEHDMIIKVVSVS